MMIFKLYDIWGRRRFAMMGVEFEITCVGQQSWCAGSASFIYGPLVQERQSMDRLDPLTALQWSYSLLLRQLRNICCQWLGTLDGRMNPFDEQWQCVVCDTAFYEQDILQTSLLIWHSWCSSRIKWRTHGHDMIKQVWKLTKKTKAKPLRV